MSILNSEAVVLSSFPQGETSKIIRLITLESGRISVIAKGSRKWNNRFGAVLEPLNHINLFYYYKENRELQILSKCDSVNLFQGIRSDLNKLAVGLSVLEITQKLFLDESESGQMFSLLTGTLSAVDEADRNILNIYRSFQLKFLKISGFDIDMSICRICGEEVKGIPAFFSRSRGGVICGKCRDDTAAVQISGEALQVLRYLIKNETGSSGKLTVSEKATGEINNLLEGYFRYHFEDYSSPQAMKLNI